MTPITSAFTSTKVALDRSLAQVGQLLEKRGIREHRYTHLRPLDPAAIEGEEAIGRIVLEFAWRRATGRPLGVRVVVAYQPRVRARRGEAFARGTTAEQAARALFWFLKAKFDAIDFGLEEFEVAFMPHLVTEGGFTFAERPRLVIERMQLADGDLRLALPPPRATEDA